MKTISIQTVVYLITLTFFSFNVSLSSQCTAKGWTKQGQDITDWTQGVETISENNAGELFRTLSATTSTAFKVQKLIAGTWIDIPFPFSGSPTKMVFDSSDNMYVAGNSSTVHMYDGSIWTLIGTTDSSIIELVINQADELFIGGFFSSVNGITSNYISKWDGTTWSSLALGLSYPLSSPSSGGVWSITFDSLGNLYAGGRFDNASGTIVNNIAKWDGLTWSTIGLGIGTVVTDVEIDNSIIYAVHNIILSNYEISVFNGISWVTMAPSSLTTIDLEFNSLGNLYASGKFPAYGADCGILTYNGSTWTCFAKTSNSTIEDLYINSNDDIYIGGFGITYVDQLTTLNYAKYGTIPDNIALDFDGVDDQVEVSNFLSQFAFTTSAWFKASTISNGGNEDRIFAYGPTDRFEVGLNNNGQLWTYDQDRGIITSYGTDLRDGFWHHVAITKTGPARAIYLDGVQVDLWNTPTIVIQYGPDFRIGNWTGSPSALAFFSGLIADVRVYDYAQTPSEIASTMNCKLSGNELNLRAWWPFEDGIPASNNIGLTQTMDYSTNSHNASLVGFSLTGNSSNFVCADQHFLFDNCCGSSDVVPPLQDFCPTNITVNTDPGACGAIVAYPTPTFLDNCDGTALPGTLLSGGAPSTFFSLGTTTIVYEYIDTNGNGPEQCSFDIIVIDNENPVLNCLPAVVTVSKPMLIYPLLYVSFTDNCQFDIASVQFSSVPSPYPYDCTDIGSTLSFNVVGQDVAGNPSNCILNITFDDCYGKCCPATLVAKPKPDPSCAFTATNKIISDQAQQYGVVHYKAGSSICLLAGFDATGTTTFIAEIEACSL